MRRYSAPAEKTSSGVLIHLIMGPQKMMPQTVRRMLRTTQEINAVCMAVFIRQKSLAPKRRDTTTDAPRLLPVAKAMKITVIG